MRHGESISPHRGTGPAEADCGSSAQQLQEAFPRLTAALRDPGTESKAFAHFSRSTLVLHRERRGTSINSKQCPEGSRIREKAPTTNPSISSGKNQFLCACSCGDYC